MAVQSGTETTPAALSNLLSNAPAGADGQTAEPPLAPCIFVLFGATGDLTRRKIMPALYSLHEQGMLPPSFQIVAFARRDKTDESFRNDVLNNMKEFAPKLPSEGPVWESFAQRITYFKASFDDPEGYKQLAGRLDQLDQQNGYKTNRLFYIATPPENFSEIIRFLGEAGLNQPVTESGWSRIIIEKPFGVDLDSAQKLNKELGGVFQENQIYRIDHYLGKETVQNILVLRFANQIFEPLWNQKYVDNVKITVAETLGMEGRGRFYEQSGITRDIVQNHALQVLTLVAMEPPTDLSADAIRDEKVKVLKSVRPFTLQDVAQYTVRGQYGPGEVKAKNGTEFAVAYRQEADVNPRSSMETFSAFRFMIDNWRWAGVPFYVRAGKRMPIRTTEVQIHFKAIPEVLFARLGGAQVQPNVLTVRVQPDEGASLEIGSKVPGPAMKIEQVRMDFKYGSSFNAPIRDAYERLILDAIRGNASLFARNDEVEAAWAIMTPILDAWQHLTCPLFPNYAAGTWGPEAARTLFNEGRVYHIS